MIFFSTLSYTCSSCTKFIIRRPLSLVFITTSAFADFFADFPEFLTSSKASIGTKDGKTEKSSENRLVRWEAIETRAIEAGLAKDILFRYAGTLKPVKLCFRVAAIRVRIVNLVSVIGFALNAFTLHTKREAHEKQVRKSWNLEHNARDQEENKRQNKISNLLFDEIFF